MRTSLPLQVAAAVLIGAQGAAAGSVCYGTPSSGRLEGGIQIPESGPNFSAYGALGVALGRTYVHSEVAATIAAAYGALAASAPGKVYVYGESGWREGGRIKPHRTHQNGLSVDFMVPVLDSAGRSRPLPTGVLNKFGYGIEFDEGGKHGDLSIDFEAMAEHLYALDQAAKARGIGISRVIFEKRFIARLEETRRGAFIKTRVPFMKGTPWIRHDEHDHVDFDVPCRGR